MMGHQVETVMICFSAFCVPGVDQTHKRRSACRRTARSAAAVSLLNVCPLMSCRTVMSLHVGMFQVFFFTVFLFPGDLPETGHLS